MYVAECTIRVALEGLLLVERINGQYETLLSHMKISRNDCWAGTGNPVHALCELHHVPREDEES